MESGNHYLTLVGTSDWNVDSLSRDVLQLRDLAKHFDGTIRIGEFRE